MTFHHNSGQRVSRRDVLQRLAGLAFGVSVHGHFGLAGLSAQAAQAQAVTPSRDVSVILLQMRGAMSHLDTFDPKPGRAEQGETKAIRTKTPGIQFTEHVPKLAGMSDRLAVLRAMTTETGAHEQATYLMRTSYTAINSIVHPSMGSWTLHAQGKRSKELPGFVLIGNGNEHPGAGFLDASYTPVPVADPDRGLENTTQPAYLSDAQFRRRLSLADRIDRAFKNAHEGPQIAAYDQMYKDATKLLGGSGLEAFDISKEPEKLKAQYGDTKFGKGCMLARRLVEAGVRCVEVELGGWDMHRDIFADVGEKATDLDTGMSGLLKDLGDRGMLDSTLVVLATEFGRTPEVNQNAGRDHHPAVFSCVLAGAGIKGGSVYGTSDERGFRPDDDAVMVSDFNTTIAHAAGLPYTKEFSAPNGRPFKIGGGGTPIKAILAS
jgi:uncharacterized protein (DUF1501 family)